MAKGLWEVVEGPIRGLRLPFMAWRSLGTENITTLDQLRAVADRIEQFQGIGCRTAQLVREELARVAPPDESGSLKRCDPESEAT